MVMGFRDMKGEDGESEGEREIRGGGDGRKGKKREQRGGRREKMWGGRERDGRRGGKHFKREITSQTGMDLCSTSVC